MPLRDYQLMSEDYFEGLTFTSLSTTNTSMQIATWNVNSINARMHTVTKWLSEAKPDVVCLQEIKTVDDAFPRMEIEALGYNIETHGQKSYNGVAILSKHPFDEVQARLPGDESDEQARYCLLYTSPSPRDGLLSRMPSSA